MLLFEHKQHLQSYYAQSSKKREIILQKEMAFEGLQQTVSDIPNPGRISLTLISHPPHTHTHTLVCMNGRLSSQNMLINDRMTLISILRMTLISIFFPLSDSFPFLIPV